MATMAKWNDKTWEVSSNKIMALENLAFSYEQKADNNTSIEEKKQTNERGKQLFPLSFSTVLHAGAGVDVLTEIESWEALVTKTGYFYLNGKRLGPSLQLRKVSVGNVKLDDFGRIRLATLSFAFQEHEQTASGTATQKRSSATSVLPQPSTKAKLKPNNVQLVDSPTVSTGVGSRVKAVGNSDYSGAPIPQEIKDRSYRISQIKENEGVVFLADAKRWVFMDEITLT